MNARVRISLLSVVAVIVASAAAQAQVGSGWTQRSYSERLQYHHTGGPNIEQISPAPGSFSDAYVSYSKSGTLRTFVFKNTTAGRCEIRVNNDYTSGQHQFQGYLTYQKPTQMLSDYDGTHVFQDFGAATHAAWKMKVMRNGDFRSEHNLLTTGAFGKTYRVNFVHNMGSHTIQVYLDGSKKVDGADEGGSSHYTKFGLYGGHAAVRSTWNDVRHYTK
jgi:hypothetical protein